MKKYDPQKYWEMRASISKGDVYKAVCVFTLPYEENLALEKVERYAMRLILKGINLRGAKVVDLGCGVGRWTDFFKRKGVFYIGVDVSKTMLKIAKERFPSSHFLKVDSIRLPFKDSVIDLIFSINVLQHNFYEHQNKLISEMIRVTKKGGFILLFEGISAKNSQTSYNMFPRTVKNWIKEVERNGAKIIRIKFVRGWIIKDIILKVVKKIKMKKEKEMKLRRILTKVGVIIDRFLLWLLPRRFATNAAMLFIKEK